MKTAPAPLKVRSAAGVLLELEDGRRIVDCISSWWVNLHGHAHPYIAEAIATQARQLEHVIFAGFTHEPAEQLVRRLRTHLPASLTRAFFSDNGSTAVEVALKMAHQYWRNIGQPQRKTFVGFEGGYHGDTVGAMSVGGSAAFWGEFKSLMFPIETVPYPYIEDDIDIRGRESASLGALRRLFESNPTGYAGVIIEPLVQGASGMRICRADFLRDLASLCQEFDVLLIFDEVMTGFGRTGDWFACVKAHVEPDIIAVSKGITGGFLPLALTLCKERIWDAFYDDDLHKAFFHSHSYTANPIACAAAVASLDLMEYDEKPFKEMEARHRSCAKRWLGGHRKVHNFRFCGTIAAMDLRLNHDSDYFSDMAPKLRNRFLQEGLLLRPLGNTIYLMPPYCIDDETLERVYGNIRLVVDSL